MATRKTAGRKIKGILIVDDHPIVRQGIQRLLEQEPDLRVCAEVDTAREAMAIIEQSPPDVAVIDITLPGADGLELTKSLRAQDYKFPILVISMHDESLYAERALRSGANGYIMKQEVAENIVEAIRRVLAGSIYVSDRAGQKILHEVSTPRTSASAPPLKRLSDRELEVFRRIGHGQTTRQIANALHLSVKTIETYRAHIKEKLDIRTATELMRFAVQWADR
jgi:DNA-binding NarL/FixJ family response regulator